MRISVQKPWLFCHDQEMAGMIALKWRCNCYSNIISSICGYCYMITLKETLDKQLKVDEGWFASRILSWTLRGETTILDFPKVKVFFYMELATSKSEGFPPLLCPTAVLGIINDSRTWTPFSSGSKVCHQTGLSGCSRTLYLILPLIYKADPWKYHIVSYDDFRELEHTVIVRLWLRGFINFQFIFSFSESMGQVLMDSDCSFIDYDMHQLNENQQMENIDSLYSRRTTVWIYINNCTIYTDFYFLG